MRLKTILNITFFYIHWSVHSESNSIIFQKDATYSVYYISVDSGLGSSVGITTDYGLGGPGSNPDGDEIFHLSRPAMGPTQPPVQWVPGLSRG